MTKTSVLISKDKNIAPTLLSKKEKLIYLANSVLDDARFFAEFKNILYNLKLTRPEVIDSFLEYNLNIYSNDGNKVYNSLANRVVLHIHNLLAGSWHIDRQKTIQKLIKKANPRHVADIGFGVPSQYVKNMVIRENRFKLTLCDLYDSAFVFAETLLNIWDDNWLGKIGFLKTDMDNHDFVGKFDLYIFQDSIEHTHYPAVYLHKYVKLSDNNARFLFSLPIGPIIPRHFIAWETVDEAMDWLDKCGLIVEAHEQVFVNPDIDLFAEQLGEDYCNLIILCAKKYTASRGDS